MAELTPEWLAEIRAGLESGELMRLRAEGLSIKAAVRDLLAEVDRLTAERDEARRLHDFAQGQHHRAVAHLAALRQRVLHIADALEVPGDGAVALHARGCVEHLRAAVGGEPAAQRAAELEPEPTDPAVIAQVREALAAGRFGCVLTTDDQPEYWPDCEACEGMGKVRPAAELDSDCTPTPDECTCPSDEACVPCGLPSVKGATDV